MNAQRLPCVSDVFPVQDHLLNLCYGLDEFCLPEISANVQRLSCVRVVYHSRDHLLILCYAIDDLCPPEDLNKCEDASLCQ